ncbi:MAG: hypothetical protein JW720_11645 [Sedimentisphaerales bacterium]|nr:hypothetical protein [Sedimentisphaerales bacterium]
MRNNDREIEYAADYLDDGKAIINLSPGEAFVCNPGWGTARIRVRPPLSKVWEPNDKEVERLVGSAGEMRRVLSHEAQAVLDLVREHAHKTGQPARLSSIAETLGITSRRKLGRIVEELKKASVVKFRQLKERGKPLTIEPLY